MEADQVPYRQGHLRLNAGDLVLTPLQPETFLPVSRESMPLQGLSAYYRTGDEQWSLFAGRPKFLRDLPGLEIETPGLVGARYLRKTGRNHFGISLTGVLDPTFADGTLGDTAGIVAGDLFREISPWTYLFTEIFATDQGALGGRLGARHRFAWGELTGAVYRFADGFPFVFPLYRPSEEGAEVNVRIQPGEFWTVTGYLNLFRDDRVQQRSDVRGGFSIARSLGSNRPHLQLTYARDEITFDSLSIGRPGVATDRLTLLVSQTSSAEFLSLIVEHLISRGQQEEERSQAFLTHRRLFGVNSIWENALLVQRDDRGDFGVTAESSVERPIRGSYFYLLGLGAAFVDRGGREQGEGVVRLGLSRRLRETGWNARVEVALPFSIGLPRSGLARRQVAFDFSHRLSWRDPGSLRSLLTGVFTGRPSGTLEGRVAVGDQGLEEVTILIDGEPRAVTARDGSYRVVRLPTGSFTVGLDTRRLDPRLKILDSPFRRVEILPNEVTRADFLLAEFSYLQGSVVVCLDGEVQAVAGARITLVGEERTWTVETSSRGGFQLDEIPPGLYELRLDPASLDPAFGVEETLRWKIDLTDDVAGYVIGINCPNQPWVDVDPGRL